MRVAVTGASGLLGSAVVAQLRKRGHEVVQLSRPAFRLGEEVPHELLAGAEALVHCAYDFKAFGWDEIRRVNVEGSLRLLKAAQNAGVGRIVFVSSIAAFDGCRSLYGKGKLQVEGRMRDAGGLVVRPGMIFGDAARRGIFGALEGAVRLPIVPVFGNGSFLFYLVHVQDVARLIADCAEDFEGWRGKLFVAAHREPITFKALLLRIGSRVTGRGVATFPVPVGVGLLMLRTLEAFGLRLAFRSDSLVSMAHFDRAPPFSPEIDYGRFRPFE
ncbi:MAG: NAD-dependent epimerase/dehydratase family protein [Burkholderiales bacterium]|nr:NAD-dependent epimerase/dehydratase family protein [Burkholderiales bacterium]